MRQGSKIKKKGQNGSPCYQNINKLPLVDVTPISMLQVQPFVHHKLLYKWMFFTSYLVTPTVNNYIFFKFYDLFHL